MQLSLSCRISEGFLSKTESTIPFAQVCDLAVAAKCQAICLRPSQLTVESSAADIAAVVDALAARGLTASMISGDVNVVYNNDQGPKCLANISSHLDLADATGASMVRVCIKSQHDLVDAQRAADEAAERGITLVQQCHIQSPFETVDQIESCLREIDRPNFGLIYEPANLEECRQDYGEATIARLAPWIRNVYLQNQRMEADGEVTLETWTYGPVSFDLIEIPDQGGIDFQRLFAGLKRVGYDGVVTIHQSAPPPAAESTNRASELMQSVKNTSEFLTKLM